MLIFLKMKRIALTVCIFYLLSINTIIGLETKNISYCGISFEVLRNNSSEISYILIHGDEETARMLLNNHIKKNNGKAFIIKSKTREVPFGPTIVDPNRLFSNIGAKRALKNFKSDWDGNELNNLLIKLEESRENFLFDIFPDKGGLLIALHNNFRGYNVKDELNDSELYSIKKDENPRDFILCTNANDYQKLKDGPYNIVLQNRMKKNNNGSLSWAAIKHGVRYINIETRLGWLSQQRKMLQFVEKMLKNN